MKANAGTFCYTPSAKMDMWAGTDAEMVSPSAVESENLEVNCVAIWQDSNTPPLLFLTIDALYPGELIRETVEKAASGVPTENIIVGASHTHQAPVADSTKPALGKLDKDFSHKLQSRIASLVSEVLIFNKAVEVEMFAGESQAHHSINRRRKMKLAFVARLLNKESIQMAPNRNGIVDETVSVLSLRRDDGSELAKIWNYACHPVAHPTPTRYSSHYAGEVRSRLRALSKQPDLPILFFQGFSGNTRPNSSVGISKSWKGLLFYLIDGNTFRNITSNGYSKWTESLSTIVQNTELRNITNSKKVTAKRLLVNGENFAKGHEFSVSFAKLDIGLHFSAIAVSAEVVAEYAELIRTANNSEIIFCIGCADNTFGYIPTKKMMIEGGYESGGYCKAFNLTNLNPDIEKNTLSALTEVGLELE